MSNNHPKYHQALTSNPDMEPKVHEIWTTGDFALISADGICFYIDSMLLSWASSVMKDVLEVGSKGDSKKELRFMDTEIESAQVLTKFVLLVTRGELSWPPSGIYITAEAFYNLITFLRKYDGERPLRVLREKIINQLLLRKMPPFYVLMSAVAMDDVELSILAFEHRYSATKQRGEESFISAALLSLSPSTFEDGTWPSQVLHRFPLDFLWACTKAWTAKWRSEYAIEIINSYSGYLTNPDQYEVDIASEYKRAIRTVRPLSSPK